jgi:DNA-binding transcriptional regulator YiaG
VDFRHNCVEDIYQKVNPMNEGLFLEMDEQQQRLHILDGQHRHRAIRELQESYRKVLGGIPVILIRAVELTKCADCGQVLSEKIPALQKLIAAMALARIADPLKLSGNDIRFLRKAMNWTAREFSSALGVSVETVSRWENGKDPIGLANEKLLRLMVGTAMQESAPAIDFDAQQVMNMKIESVRSAEEMRSMCFERVKFKRPSHPKEEQWDSTEEPPRKGGLTKAYQTASAAPKSERRCSQ